MTGPVLGMAVWMSAAALSANNTARPLDGDPARREAVRPGRLSKTQKPEPWAR